MAVIDRRTTKTGEVRYRARIRLKGRPSMVRSFRRKTDAKVWAQQVEADLRRGIQLPSREAQHRTLAELIDRYREERLMHLNPADRQKRWRQIVWWREELGAYYLSELRPSLLVDARSRLARRGRQGRPITPATQNRYLAALSAVLTFGVRELEWLDDNPARKVRRKREPRGRVRFLSNDERERLLAVCRERSPRLYLLAVMAIYTGMRRGELLNLRWRDVDLEKGIVTVHESKNNDRRAVPIAGPALEALRDCGRVRRIESDLVFATRRGRAPFPKRAWEEALEEAGIEDFRFHDCRHTAASYLAQSGARLYEIADVLGHRTLIMVKRYAHLTEQHTATVVQRMTEKFSSS